MLTAVENKHEDNPDVPRADVVLVDVPFEPTNDAVIGSRQQPSCTNGIVCTDVCNDVDLGAESHVAPNEFAEEWGEWSSNEPESDRMEDQLVAAVGVLLPTRKLVIDL